MFATLFATLFLTKPCFIQEEAEAKETKRGMWSLGEKYISPREWRQIQRGSSSFRWKYTDAK